LRSFINMFLQSN